MVYHSADSFCVSIGCGLHNENRGQNCVLRGQILKSREPYRLVPRMKALDECFPDQLEY
jgi:hypothetical protein